MATKLERDAEAIAKKMRELTVEVDAFGKRKLATLPKGAAWPLLQAALGLVSAASKVQLAAATKHFKDTKKHFSETVHP
jgi:hypothetical protein